MELKIDFRSGIPIYLQVVEQVQDMVVRGELKPGDQLPTVRQMALDLRVNFNTIARAYRILDEARLISTQRGRGTYILEKPNEATIRELREQGLDALARKFIAEAVRLGCSQEEVQAAFHDQFAAWEAISKESNIQETE
jgi:GntR family transcriptional regulator